MKNNSIKRIEDIEATLHFSEAMLDNFNMNQEDFKALTIQKVLQMLPRKGVDTALAATPDFWERVQSNMELYKLRVSDEIEKHQTLTGYTLSMNERIDFFFEYLEKNTDK